MKKNKRVRQAQAAKRLVEALHNPDHEWKSEDGPAKAELVLSNLQKKGVSA